MTLHPVIITGGGIACILTAGSIYLTGLEAKYRATGKEFEATLVNIISKSLFPLVLGGGMLLLLMNFPFNLFFMYRGETNVFMLKGSKVCF